MPRMVKSVLVTLLTVIVSALGGFDLLLRSFLILLAIDYFLGLTVAGVFSRSKKTENGGLSSYVGLIGLVKKMSILLLIIIAVEIDYILNLNQVTRNGTIIFFALNELISITENVGLIGLPIPTPIKRAIEILRRIDEKDDKDV